MKKAIKAACILFALAVSGVMCICASADGSIIGNTLYTDISSSINDYAIASYNINGYMAVVAADLRDYGFNVDWSEEERAVYITRSQTNTVSSVYTAPAVNKERVGQRVHNVYATDIKTYVDGNFVDSYNIGGKTIIYFSALEHFGESTYDDATRTLKLDIADGLQYKLGDPLANDLYFTKNSANGLSFYINAVNNTNKTIKYFHVEFFMLNSVFDYAYDMYNRCSFKMNIIGPISPGAAIANAGSESGADTYNDNLCSYIVVQNVFIEYMDGTSETVNYVDAGTERTENSGYDF